MAIGRVSGAMLSSNLDRQGAPLNFVSGLNTLMHLDFSGSQIGINTDNVSETLTVNGTIGTANTSDFPGMVIDGSRIYAKNNGTLSITSAIDLGDLSTVYIEGGNNLDVVTTDGNGNLTWGNVTALLNTEDFLQNVTINGATISTNVPDGNLVISGLGSGQVTSPAMDVVTLNATNFTSNNMDGTLTGTFYGNATGTFTGSVETPAQPLITSVGTLSSLSVAGNISAPTVNATMHGDVYTDNIYGIDGNLTITPKGNTLVTINSTGAQVLPTGTVGQRPAAVAGAIRYNTDTSSPEYYNGNSWVVMASGVSSQTLYGNGSQDQFSLNYPTTAQSIIVSINGTLQQPGVAYGVTTSGTFIIFAEVPLNGDVIEIRFLSTSVIIEMLQENAITVVSPVIDYGTTPVVMDEFRMVDYRSAKYTISGITGTGSPIIADVLVTHDGITPTVGASKVGIDTNAIFTAVSAAGNVQVLVSTLASGASLKVYKLYFPI